MIPAISEINFPSYATLNQATVSLQDMGERVITAQVKIDGDIVPDFTGWELEFKGERFVLTTDSPHATKDNSSACFTAELTFKSWVIEQLKMYFFVQMASTDPSNPNANVVADKYNASLRLSFEDFVTAFNKTLNHYYAGEIEMEYDTSKTYSTDVVDVELSYTKIWDFLANEFYDKYGFRWYITYDESASKYKIMVNFDAEEIEHIFQYGYDGGLIKFERQVEDEDIENVILGRGGEKNLPYRYFKKRDQDNPEWAPDPDAIPELENIYFDRLRDSIFRWYVKGWKTNPHRQLGTGDYVETYNPTLPPLDCLAAYQQGHIDEVFDPWEFVSDLDSIQKYRTRYGAMDDDDDIYPTIQGVYRGSLGRVDEVVDVEQVTTDDIDDANAASATYIEIRGTRTVSVTTPRTAGSKESHLIYLQEFEVPEGCIGRIQYSWLSPGKKTTSNGLVDFKDENGEPYATIDTSESEVYVMDEDGNKLSPYGLTAGRYFPRVNVTIRCEKTIPTVGREHSYQIYTIGVDTMQLVLTKENPSWGDTFDIWVKNIWETTQVAYESDEHYTNRVWAPILGDRLGSEAKVVFSDGPMAISSDYEFLIASYPVPDRTKTITTEDEDGNEITVPSEWRISLVKSDAELDTLGLYIPNSKSAQASAGQHIFFTGIDMPFAYTMWAEEALHEKKKEYLQTKCDANPVWSISIDKVRAHTLEEDDLGELLADKFATGAKLTITDPRFTPQQGLVLQAASVTYTWQGDGAIVPDIDIVLSDKVLETRDLLLDIERRTLSKSRSIISNQVNGVYDYINAAVAKRSGGQMDLDLPLSFGSVLQSKDFAQGIVGGAGWGIYRDGDGRTVLEVDKILTRNSLEVNSVVSNQVSYIGGKQIRSAASIEVTSVADTDDGYICQFDQRAGSVANLFQVGDIALGQVFDAENNQTSYFRRLVTAVDVNSITLSKTDVSGTGVPSVGDTLVQFGNTTDPARQFVIVSDVIGGGYEQMLSGLDSVSATGSEYYFAGAKYSTAQERIVLNDADDAELHDSDDDILGYLGKSVTTSPRWFVGNKSGDYAEWEDGALTVKGRIYVRKSGESTYNDLDGYLNELEYLEAALPKDTANITTISGGLVLSKIIGVTKFSETYQEDLLVAGINASSLGEDSEHGTLMIFAGATTASQVANSKFRVYGDGHVVMNDMVAINSDDDTSVAIGYGKVIAKTDTGDVCVTVTGGSIGESSTNPETKTWAAFSSSKSIYNAGPSSMEEAHTVTGTYTLSSLSSSVTQSGRLTVPQRTFNIVLAFSSAYQSLESGRVITTLKLYCNGSLVDSATRTESFPNGTVSFSLTIPQNVIPLSDEYVLRYDLEISFRSTKTNTLTVTYSSPSTTVSYVQNTQNVVLGNDGIRVQLASDAYFLAKIASSTPTVQMMTQDYGLTVSSSGMYLKLGQTTYQASVGYDGSNYYLKLTAV